MNDSANDSANDNAQDSGRCCGGECSCHTPEPQFYPVEKILNFVSKTIAHGAPKSVALKRAASKFKVDRNIIRAFWQGL